MRQYMNRHKTLTPLRALQDVAHTLQGYLTRQQMAEIFKVSPLTIRLWQRRDGLPVHRIGTQPVYLASEVEGWFNQRPNRLHGGRVVWGG